MPSAANRELLVHRYTEARDAARPVAHLRAALVTAYRPELLKIARAWVREMPGPVYDLDDLLQESAIVLLRLLDTADVRNFGPMLRASTRNRFRDMRHTERKRAHAALDDYQPSARIDGARMYATAYAPELR